MAKYQRIEFQAAENQVPAGLHLLVQLCPPLNRIDSEHVKAPRLLPLLSVRAKFMQPFWQPRPLGQSVELRTFNP